MSRTFASLAAALALSFATASFAAAPINTLKPGIFSDTPTGIAILGYDTVAYFTDSRAVPGKDSFVTDWMGAKWKFASAEHLALFKAMPEKYAPQYGGYCAYGVAKDHLVKIEPNQFTVVDGKLYLNYDADVLQQWLKNKPGFISQADAKFPTLLKQ